MGNPINNLGDYNEVRKDLQNAGGSKDKLYKDIGDTAVAKATPELLFIGGAIGVVVCGIVELGKKGFMFMKNRKEMIKNEPALKREFANTVKNEIMREDVKELSEDVVE